MNFTFLNTITRNAIFKANIDGSIKATGVITQIKIVGSPIRKFIQNDQVSAFDIPAITTSEQKLDYIDTQSQAYVTATYPNT